VRVLTCLRARTNSALADVTVPLRRPKIARKVADPWPFRDIPAENENCIPLVLQCEAADQALEERNEVRLRSGWMQRKRFPETKKLLLTDVAISRTV
jgi:hypothetical protein